MTRWSRGRGVRREHDFTAAPRVVDRHESDHLGDGRASWHGPPSHRAVAGAVGLLAVAGLAFLGFFAVSDLSGAQADGAPSAAADSEAGGPGLPDDPAPGGAAGNASSPLPLPTVAPPLP